jgi:hypothetical protein
VRSLGSRSWPVVAALALAVVAVVVLFTTDDGDGRRIERSIQDAKTA